MITSIFLTILTALSLSSLYAVFHSLFHLKDKYSYRIMLINLAFIGVILGIFYLFNFNKHYDQSLLNLNQYLFVLSLVITCISSIIKPILIKTKKW